MRNLAILLFGLVVAAAGCGGDNNEAAPIGTGGEGGTAGADAGDAMADAVGDVVGDGALPTDQCMNTSDMAALQATYGDGGTIQSVAADCGKSCLNDADIHTCTTNCIVQGTGNQISSGCAGCAADSVECTITNCLTACFADPLSAGCVACQCGGNSSHINCLDAYESCSGVANTVCPKDGGTDAATDAQSEAAADAQSEASPDAPADVSTDTSM